MNNFYLIDKAIDYTSFDVIRILRKRFNIKKMWHTWTLDPLASGALLVATWNYTKLISYLEKDTKEYEFEIMLDWITDSFDLWEEVNFLPQEKQDEFAEKIKQEDIEIILKNNFSWKILQVPPKYSALKIWWKKAYELARKWEDIKMKAREVEIFNIEILSFEYPKLSLKAKVSAWTYIRSIAADLWEILQTGWYISKLRRIKIWNFNIDEAYNLDSIDIYNNIDLKNMFNKDLFISLEDDILTKINNWLQINANFDFPKNKDLFVFDGKNITNIVHYDWKTLKAVKKI